MAIWQFEVAFVSRQDDALPHVHRVFDLAAPAEGSMPRVRALLQSRLGAPCVVGAGVASHGQLDGNRIDLIELGERREFWACIDARADSDEFCRLVCTMAQLMDCELFVPEYGSALPPRYPALIAALMSSTAWCFALMPTLFKRCAYGWERVAEPRR